jgi:hypothetical protein
MALTTVSASMFIRNVVSKVTTYTATKYDDLILCSGSAFTVTLPAASDGVKMFVIRKTDTSLTNIITVARAGSDTFTDNAASLTSTTLNTIGETITLVSDGVSVWHVLDRHIPSVSTSYTISASSWAAGVGSYTASYKRLQDSAQILIKMILSGAVTADQLTFSMTQLVGNAGFTVDIADFLVTAAAEEMMAVGTWIGYDRGAAIYGGEAAYYGVNNNILLFNNNNNAVTQNTPFTWGNLDTIGINIIVPISGWKG